PSRCSRSASGPPSPTPSSETFRHSLCRSSPVLHFSAIMGEEHRAAGGGALSTPDRACRALAAFFGAGPREVECAYVFGSRSRGQAGPLSDLDLGIVVREALSPQARLEL